MCENSIIERFKVCVSKDDKEYLEGKYEIAIESGSSGSIYDIIE